MLKIVLVAQGVKTTFMQRHTANVVAEIEKEQVKPRETIVQARVISAQKGVKAERGDIIEVVVLR
jgi:hypothetical protein